jgi:hypothetical protein
MLPEGEVLTNLLSHNPKQFLVYKQRVVLDGVIVPFVNTDNATGLKISV